MPKVSICIPAYNRPDTLRRCLKSIAGQSFRDFEVIITDDSLTDNVEKAVNEFRDMLAIRYYKNNVRLGSPKNWNSAVRRANGKYIKIIHHDDWFSTENSLSIYVNEIIEISANQF